MSYRLTKVVPVHGCSCKLPPVPAWRFAGKSRLNRRLRRRRLGGSLGKQQRRQNHRQPCGLEHA